MVSLNRISCDIFIPLRASKSFRNPYQWVQMINNLLKYILRNNFLKDLDAQCDFEKEIGQAEPFLSYRYCSNCQLLKRKKIRHDTEKRAASCGLFAGFDDSL